MSPTANSGTCAMGTLAPARNRPALAATPDLRSYDRIAIFLSGGKDSEAMLDVVYKAATAAGITARLVTVFADLGDKDEWAGTAEMGERSAELVAHYGDRPGARELAAQHAAHYGIRHEVVCRMVDAHGGTRVQQTLSEHIEERGMWPDAENRFCTSDMKRAAGDVLLTRLARELREEWKVQAAGTRSRPRRVRILNVMGLRAEESPKRRKMAPFSHNDRASNLSVRSVDEWLPIHTWTVEDVWERIFDASLEWHWAYDAGMPRLSCRFCPLASKGALIRAAQIDPGGARERLAMERRMDARGAGRDKGRKVGSDFRQGLSMTTIIEQADAATAAGIEVTASNWAA